MRKFIAVIMIALMAFGLCACNETGASAIIVGSTFISLIMSRAIAPPFPVGMITPLGLNSTPLNAVLCS